MPAIINFKATQADYVDALQIGPFQNGRQVAFIVANQSVKLQLARRTKSGSADWDREDIPLPPFQGGFDDVAGIRFKSYDPTKSAVVVAVLFFDNDPLPVGGQPFSSLLNPNGTIAQNPLPSGMETFWPMPTPPSWAVIRDGSTYDGTQATYVGLWNVIGNTYGGTGQNNFKVPDHQGRVMVGLGSNTDCDAVTDNDGLVLASRSPIHNSTFSLNAQVTAQGGVGGVNGVQNGNPIGPNSYPVTGTIGPGGSRPNDMPAYGVGLPIITL